MYKTSSVTKSTNYQNDASAGWSIIYLCTDLLIWKTINDRWNYHIPY